MRSSLHGAREKRARKKNIYCTSRTGVPGVGPFQHPQPVWGSFQRAAPPSDSSARLESCLASPVVCSLRPAAAPPTWPLEAEAHRPGGEGRSQLSCPAFRSLCCRAGAGRRPRLSERTGKANKTASTAAATGRDRGVSLPLRLLSSLACNWQRRLSQ